MTEKPKPASGFTAEANRRAAGRFPMDDRADYADADRGFIAPLPGVIVNDHGHTVRDSHLLDYITDDAPCPDTVHPSLWRQSQIIKRGGLYQVVDGLYQIRMSANITIVDAPDGLVIVDCGTSVDLARAGMELFRRETGNDKPVVAVIYTHTHFDHYGGVKGIVDEGDVSSGRVPIIAPGTLASFNKYAIGENVITGNAMSRRMGYTFGVLLPHCDRGLVTIGLSAGDDAAEPAFSFIPPTDPVTRTGEMRRLGGWTFEFLYAPDTEAPEEMHIWIPAIKALTCAENANHTMHNVQTIRGARTRDARNFARYLDVTLVRWGEQAEVHYGPHTWPVWGNANITVFLENQRDVYKYIHDQSLRLANQGLTPLEAAETVELPRALGGKWYNRYYHGGLHPNVRAVFHKELGFWDGDPATILPLLPADSARRHVELIGREKLLAEGRQAIAAGDYRWAVQVLHHLVFADPKDDEAREAQADAYEQLGYQQEVPQYRAIFLCAALELREGIRTEGQANTDSGDTIMAMPIDLLFDYAAVHVDGEKAAEADVRINFEFSDEDPAQHWTMWVRHGVLNAREGTAEDAQLTVAGTKAGLVTTLLQPLKARRMSGTSQLSFTGDTAVLARYGALLDAFDPSFALITP
jgi:alkyl sulfatase BDS1-like metallo-beta-lactamase superfamily hydrolase